MRKVFVIASVFVVAAGLAGCAQAVQEKEDMLAAAGFRVKPADTAEKVDQLKKLPPHTFVMRRTPQGSISYLFADPTVCGCLYYGTEANYTQYQRIAQAQRLADKQLMAAQMARDASWNWGVWGPWGPYGWY